MREQEPPTLQAIVGRLPALGSRCAVGLRGDLGVRWWSYERLYQGAHDAAALLREAGVDKGDHVLIRGQSSPEWVAFFFGAILRGAVVVPIDYDSSEDLVRRIAAIVRPKVFVTSGETIEPQDLGPFLMLNALHPPVPEGGARVARQDVIRPVAPSDPAIIFYTSGTTSAPRGVILTHGNIMAQIARFRRWRPLARLVSFRMLVMAPLSHAQGIMLGVAIPLSVGLSVIYTHSSHPGHLIRLLRDNRILLFSTVPRVLHMLANVFESQQYGEGPETLSGKLGTARAWIFRRHYIFTHMRAAVGYWFWIVLVGGAPLPEADERFWRDSGCLLVQGYGLTETTAIISVNFPMFGAFGSVGKALGNQEIRLAEDGEILVRGPNVMPSYFGEADSGNGVFSGGFLQTGDIGRFDSRNRLFVLGRKKEVIVTGEGFNVYAADIEAVLNLAPEVEDSVVFGLARDGHTQVHAVLLLRPDSDAAELVRRSNQQLIAHQRIQSWTVWVEPDFPRSALMKPKRRQIEEQVSQGVALAKNGGNSRPSSMEDVLKIEDRQKRILELSRYIVHADGSGSDARNLSLIRDIGLSSLDVIEMIALLERQSGRVLDNIVMGEEVTVSELQSLVRNPSKGQNVPRRYVVGVPRWPELGILQAVRRVLNPAILKTMVGLNTRLSVSGYENLTGIEPPVIFAGSGHEHGFDVLLIYSALPRHLQKRLAVVASRWVFSHFLDPGPGVTFGQRLLVGLGFHLLVPLFFPFVLSSQFGRSRETLMEACRLIDRGFSLIAFEGKGMGVVARQCGVPIIPVQLGNSRSAGFLPRLRRAPVSVTFGRPLFTGPEVSDSELTLLLEKLCERSSTS